MKIASILDHVEYSEHKPAVSVLINNATTKELRIALRKGQVMSAHKTAFPIVVQVFEGEIYFSVAGEKKHLRRGDLIALDGNVVHELTGIEDSIIRLSLSKQDSAQRVFSLVQ